MADVFLSYASTDVSLAEAIAARLESAGWSVWWDRHLVSGDRFQPVIQEQLATAASVLVLWTADSITSEWVYSEARRGHRRGVLVQVRDQSLEIDDLPAPFDALHCPVVDDFEALVGGISARVRAPITEPSAPVGGLSRLPIPATPLLGRLTECAELGEMVAQHRLITLTGPGGTGKTRLAIEVATAALDAFPGGVHLVDLTAETDPDLVLPALARGLGLPDQAGVGVVEALTRGLRAGRTLVVVDNLEHVLDAARDLTALLAAAPALHLLVTSREPLRVPGERQYGVDPLSVDDAVELFVERAQATRASFRLTDQNEPAVRQLCGRLDGLPLAIELAAARTRALTPQAVLDRLGARLELLTGGGRTAPARHQTLRATIDWSHDLLEESERRVFARLGVFSSGCRLESAETVCGVGGTGAIDVLDAISALLDKSLLRESDTPDGELRYAMLETVREYAAEQLAQHADADRVREAHADHMIDLAQRATALAREQDGGSGIARLEEEHDNLRAALAHLWTGDPTGARAMHLVDASWRSWLRTGRLREAVVLIETTLDRAPEGADALLLVQTRLDLSEFYRFLGDMSRALELKVAALDVLRDEDHVRAAYTLTDVGSVAAHRGEYDSALRYLSEALDLGTRMDHPAARAHAHAGLAELTLMTRDLRASGEHASESTRIGRQLGDAEMVQDGVMGTAWVDFLSARLDEARQNLLEALQMALEMKDLGRMVDGLALLAAVRWSSGHAEEAVQLLACATEGATASGLELYFYADIDELTRDLRSELGDATFHRAWETGPDTAPASMVRTALDA